MNVNVLIDNVVRQTTVLIAQLATTAGLRAPLAHLANEVFLDLVHELEAHGVSRKVAADMFGLALRSYQEKVHRLEESQTDHNRSLWEAVLEYVRTQGPVTRSQVGLRFRHDDDRVLAGVLHDQVESGLVYTSGHGPSAIYRVTSEDELQQALGPDGPEALDALVWIATHRLGPVGSGELAAKLGLDPSDVSATLERLTAEGRILVDTQTDPPTYTSHTCVLPLGSPIGWEAALFDHYAALVQTLVVKLQQGATRTLPADVVGGSTYGFEIWPGHPFEERVRALLREHRTALSALREDVERYNQKEGLPADGYTEVLFYFGQSLRDRSGGNGHDGEA